MSVQLLEKIACGANGCVYTIKENPDVVVKMMRREKECISETSRNDIVAVALPKNLLQTATLLIPGTTCVSPDRWHRFLFYRRGDMDLFDFIYALDDAAFDVLTKMIIKSIPTIYKVLKILNSKGIYHRDIKLENLIISGKSIVVADFGALTDDVEDGYDIEGTPGYMSPLYLFKIFEGEKKPVWSENFSDYDLHRLQHFYQAYRKAYYKRKILPRNVMKYYERFSKKAASMDMGTLMVKNDMFAFGISLMVVFVKMCCHLGTSGRETVPGFIKELPRLIGGLIFEPDLGGFQSWDDFSFKSTSKSDIAVSSLHPWIDGKDPFCMS